MTTTLRERHASRTSARIVDAALDLFAEFGYAATTVEQIAARAEVGRRTFFRYFPNKEAVLFGDFGLRGRQMLECLQQRPAGEQPLSSLVAALRVVCADEMDLERSRRIRAVIDDTPDLVQRQRLVVRKQFEESVVAALSDRHPEHSEFELRALTNAAMGALQVAMRSSLTEGERSLRASFDEAITFVVAACADYVEPVD